MDDGFALSIEPDVKSVRSAAQAWSRNETLLLGRPLRHWRRETREALGLPNDAIVVMTGHQAQIWHAGILAKWFVADAYAIELNGRAAQLVVDQDVQDPALVTYPAEREGRLVSVALPMVPARRDGPTGLQPAVMLGTPLAVPLIEAAAGVDRIVGALRDASGAANAAAQFVSANDALLAPFIGSMPAVFASQLLATPLGEALLDAMCRDPAGVVSAYDNALASDPHAARSLNAARREVPLWRLERGRNERERVVVAADGTLPTGLIAPRAFLMTAFARLALCDLFVHGTGARRYERVTEDWIRRWLGVELAPMVVATATLKLPLDRFVSATPLATIGELRRLRADPDADGAAPSPAKRAWLDRIHSPPRRSAERRAQYRAMLAYLTERRAAHAPQLDQIAALVDSSREHTAVTQLATSRTWPWPLHESARVIALRDAVRADLAGRAAYPVPTVGR